MLTLLNLSCQLRRHLITEASFSQPSFCLDLLALCGGYYLGEFEDGMESHCPCVPDAKHRPNSGSVIKKLENGDPVATLKEP